MIFSVQESSFFVFVLVLIAALSVNVVTLMIIWKNMDKRITLQDVDEIVEEFKKKFRKGK